MRAFVTNQGLGQVRTSSGFTLIEAMIVVALIAVLVGVAYPGYVQYSERARRGDGQNMLLQAAAAQERFFTVNNRYALSVAELGASPNSLDGHYQLGVAAGPSGDAQTFQLTATPVGVQATDGCADLSYNSLGERDHTGTTTNGRCWSN